MRVFWRTHEDDRGLLKFNVDQPRAANGQFGEGSSEKNASDLFDSGSDYKSADQLVAQHPGLAEKIDTINKKLEQGTETVKTYTDANGVYTDERAALHNEIISGILNPRDVALATPGAGEDPTLTILGGRGGSGKGWLTSPDGPIATGTSIYVNPD